MAMNTVSEKEQRKLLTMLETERQNLIADRDHSTRINAEVGARLQVIKHDIAAKRRRHEDTNKLIISQRHEKLLFDESNDGIADCTSQLLELEPKLADVKRIVERFDIEAARAADTEWLRDNFTAWALEGLKKYADYLARPGRRSDTQAAISEIAVALHYFAKHLTAAPVVAPTPDPNFVQLRCLITYHYSRGMEVISWNAGDLFAVLPDKAAWLLAARTAPRYAANPGGAYSAYTSNDYEKPAAKPQGVPFFELVNPDDARRLPKLPGQPVGVIGNVTAMLEAGWKSFVGDDDDPAIKQ